MNLLDQLGVLLTDLPVYLANGGVGHPVLAGSAFGCPGQPVLCSRDGASAGCRDPSSEPAFALDASIAAEMAVPTVPSRAQPR